MASEGLRRHYIMHVSLLHLNRLLKDDIKFKTELRVRLVDDRRPCTSGISKHLDTHGQNGSVV